MHFQRSRPTLSALILVLMIVALVVLIPKPVRADSSVLDGTGSSGTCYQPGCSSQLISTNQAEDVIVVAAVTIGGNITSVSDSNGLTFTERISYPSPIAQTGNTNRIYEFYAIAPDPLTSDNVTLNHGSCCDAVWGMVVVAIHGTDTSAPFDPNPSIPGTVSCPGPSCGNCTANFNQGNCSDSIQTSTLDFVIATTAINDADPCGATDFSPVLGPRSTGFTMLGGNGKYEVDYAITSAANENLVFNCGGTDASAIVMDAVSLGGTPSGYDPHVPIIINGDSGFTGDNGVTGGSGTSVDPYVIENWYIDTSGNGIQISNTDVCFIIQNVFLRSEGAFSSTAVSFTNVTGNAILADSTIQLFNEGVFAEASSNITLSGNTIQGGGEAIFLRAPQNTEIQNNYLSGSGVRVLYASNLDIGGNNLSGASAFVGRSTSFSFTGNQLAEGGVQIDQSNNFQVSNNQLWYYSGTGIDISRSNADGLLITDNTIYYDNVGISLESSNGLYISGNMINHNNIAIDMNYPYVPYTGYTTITSNMIIVNGVGVVLNYTHDMLVYHNRFVGNNVQAVDDQGTNNSWDNGYPAGGNYWSDYTGTDPDNDGIGDTPYVFNSNQDNYPLMFPPMI